MVTASSATEPPARTASARSDPSFGAGTPPNLEAAAEVLDRTRRAGGTALAEPDGLTLLEALGIAIPRRIVFEPETLVSKARLGSLGGDQVVIKAVAAGLVHKSDVGGVAIVEREPEAAAAAIAAMAARLAPRRLVGILVEELVDHDPGPGGELLVSLRWTADFGPVVSVGLGGVHAELLARDLRRGQDVVIVAPDLTPSTDLATTLRAATAVRLVTEPQRGRPALASVAALIDVVERLAALAPLTGPGGLLECELNPLAVTPEGLVALDVLVTLDPRPARPSAAAPVRPVAKLGRLLEPQSIAIAGVSSGSNPGRIILRNVLRDGFDPKRVVIIKPGATEIDGCRCVPDVSGLPGKVDLLVVAVSAALAAEMVAEVAERDLAESVIVIPGGFDETAAGTGLAARLRAALDGARGRPGGGPVVNGGNCLGIRSRPGRYDTFFIPDTKLAAPSGNPVPLAIVAQSGAFALSRLSRLPGLDPKYVITVGNQIDLTIGDHLAHLADDPDVRVVGVYVEGFAALDGRRFVEAARAISTRGGVVILYRAGRTAAGASASASHTAAIAGDAVVTHQLVAQAGVVVADSLEDFDDFVRTFVLLDGRAVAGPRLGAVSNAGFECVAIADAADTLVPATLSTATTGRLAGLLGEARIAGVVDVHNPFDLTPMGDDATFAAAAEAVLADPGVDVGLVGNVPFTAALQTLPAGPDSPEDLAAPGAIAARLVDLWRRTTKAWVAVVDAGPRYDPLAAVMERGGIPTFRTADTAIRTLGAVVGRASARPPSIDGGSGAG